MPLNDMQLLEFMEERHNIWENRNLGLEWPWTQDEILQTYKFTNVYRELDKTTAWFRENIRDEMARNPDVVFATVVYRWFNLIEVGEVIRPYITGGLFGWDKKKIHELLTMHWRKNPIVNGAYIIRSPEGYSKLDGILELIDQFIELYPGILLDLGCCTSLQKAHQVFLRIPLIGQFMAYEIVSDLRWTSLLWSADDILTWANPGPGARRGLARHYGTWPKLATDNKRCVAQMQEILKEAKEIWPTRWPDLEMREIEHSLCEYDKYRRVIQGEGKPKAKFHYKGE